MFTRSLKHLHYKQLFLYGAYVTIMILAFPAAIIDYLIGSRVDVGIDLAFGLLTYGAYRYSFRRGDTTRSAVLLFWIATLFEFVYLSVHAIDFDLIFSVLIPLIAFIAFPRGKMLPHLLLYYLLLLGYLAYGYVTYPDHPYLHNDRFLLALGVSHGFILSFGLFYAMAIDESMERLERSNRAQSLLLSEVHHRVKNNLNLIASILGLQSQRHTDPRMAALLEENRQRIESMAILHEILYRDEALEGIDLRRYLDRLIDHLVESTESGSVAIARQIDPIVLPMDHLILMGILINELITNSIKHAADPEGKVTIRLRITRTGEGYRLRYCDGAGKVEMDRLERGFGISLIRMAAEHLRGMLRIDAAEGLCYEMDVKGGER